MTYMTVTPLRISQAREVLARGGDAAIQRAARRVLIAHLEGVRACSDDVWAVHRFCEAA